MTRLDVLLIAIGFIWLWFSGKYIGWMISYFVGGPLGSIEKEWTDE